MNILYEEMINLIKEGVGNLLADDNSGHGLEHAESVAALACQIIKRDGGDPIVTELTALLHDVDDYKLFGLENAKKLTNAKAIMKKAYVPENIKKQVLHAVSTIGYNKRLRGIVPDTPEAKAVSDADMLEIMGVTGVMRSYQYRIAKKSAFFDPAIYPVRNMTAEEYMGQNIGNSTAVNHMFEKVLTLKGLMLTEHGKKLARTRHKHMVQFLYDFFEEQNVPEWTNYLDIYLDVYLAD